MNVQNKDGIAALCGGGGGASSWNGHLEVVRRALLFNDGVDVFIKNNMAGTALDVAP